MNSEILTIIEQLAREKGIEKAVLYDALKFAIEAAARKRMPEINNIQGQFNEETGEVEILIEKTVVKKIKDSSNEIDLKTAKKDFEDIELGETIWVEHKLEDYGRIAAQLAKQVILQKVREAEIETVYNDFIDKKGELVNGIVQRAERGDLFVDLGKAEGILPRREQVFRETFNRGERVRAYILDVKKTPKNAMVILSRTHVDLIRRLFEMEVPEISEGMVEIMGIVREPNGRTKIAVRTNDRDIDAVGACVGMRGMRVQSIVQELRGEKIDIVEYSEDPEVFIKKALSPAKISRVITDQNEQHMTIIVADDQMSLAIGKKGQNVKLAAKLVKWKIDIKGESEAGNILEQSSTQIQRGNDQKTFIETLNNMDDLNESMIQSLLNHGIQTFQDILDYDKETLCEKSGMDMETAETVINIANFHSREKPKPESEESEAAELSEEQTQAEVVTVDKGKEEEAGIDPDSETEGSLDEEDQEYPLEALADISEDIIKILSNSGFQTLAELSITPLEELMALEGIDESIAKLILEQAKQMTEKV